MGVDAVMPPFQFEGARLINDRDYTPAAVHLINQAERRIYLLQFVIYDDGAVGQILDALISAQSRGVDIQVMADEEAGQTSQALQRLQEAGIDTKLDDPGVTTHNKMLVVDDHVLVGSHNFSANAMERNIESSVWVRRPQVTAFYARYFESLWQNTPRPDSREWSGEDDIMPIADRDIVHHLYACIEGAQTRVRIVLYAMTYNREYPDSDAIRLVDALVAARHRGVHVQIALDGSQWIRDNGINHAAMAVLLEGQVELRITPRRRVTHAKAVNCDDVLIIGDANWAHSSFALYNGTSVRLSRPENLREFEDWFANIWSESEGL
jgi:phosphatidylserine/phosphatidylglycerophosphate/cardiolipin synthase-like enzyme